jgi:hypothetical protein
MKGMLGKECEKMDRESQRERGKRARAGGRDMRREVKRRRRGRRQ